MAEYGAAIPGILNQQDFDTSVTTWVELINTANEATLREVFFTGDKPVSGLGFELERLAQLVSTIGAARIKARFIVRPLVPGGKPQFLLALFAVDTLDARVSSYYVAETLYTNELALKPRAAHYPLVHAKQVSNVLVQRWLDNWNKATTNPDPSRPVSSYFATPYGPLRGYTFDIGEFAAIFHNVRILDGQMFRISFVLHDYYQADPMGGNILAETFALALHVHSKHDDGQANDDPDDLPVLDMGQPCPPHC